MLKATTARSNKAVNSREKKSVKRLTCFISVTLYLRFAVAATSTKLVSPLGSTTVNPRGQLHTQQVIHADRQTQSIRRSLSLCLAPVEQQTQISASWRRGPVTSRMRGAQSRPLSSDLSVSDQTPPMTSLLLTS